MMNKILILLFLFLPNLLVAQQSKNVYGNVYNEKEAPISYANVLRLGTTTGTTTDTLGYFSLDAVVGDSLVFSYLGYRSIGLKVVEEMELPIQIRFEEKMELLLQDHIVTIKGVRPPIESQSSTPVMTLGTADLRRDDGISIRPALNRVPGVLMHSAATRPAYK